LTTIDDLINNLHPTNEEAFRNAADALAAIGDSAIEALTNVVNDPNEHRRFMVIQALGHIGDPRAVAALINLFDYPDDLDDDMVYETEELSFDAAKALAKIGASAVDALLMTLHHPNPHCRARACFALGLIGEPRFVDPLLIALKDSDEAVQAYAAFALGKIGGSRPIEALIANLSDVRWGVRRDTATALGQINDTRIVEPLIAALQDSDWKVRSAAAHAIGEIYDPRTLKPLLKALNDPEWGVVFDAARSLKKKYPITAAAAIRRFEKLERQRYRAMLPYEYKSRPAKLWHNLKNNSWLSRLSYHLKN
jgi:HEAT repeat protein